VAEPLGLSCLIHSQKILLFAPVTSRETKRQLIIIGMMSISLVDNSLKVD